MFDDYFNNNNQMNLDFLPEFHLIHNEMNINPFEDLNLNPFEGLSFEKPVPLEEGNPFENVLIPESESNDIHQIENPFQIKDESILESHKELEMVLDENVEQ